MNHMTVMATCNVIALYPAVLFIALYLNYAQIPAGTRRQEISSCHGVAIHNECIFIFSTGRSGSTALMHALNMVDDIFVMGENNFFFKDFLLLEKTAVDAKVLASAQVLQCLRETIFKEVYGRGTFDEMMVGYKEIRLKVADSYEEFAALLAYHRRLCRQPRIIFNYRLNASATAESGFYARHNFPGKNETMELLLRFQNFAGKYSEENKGVTFTVVMEDMFDGSKNQTLAKNLLRYVNRSTDIDISFANIRRG